MIFCYKTFSENTVKKMHEALLQLQKLINRPRFYYKNHGFQTFLVTTI